MKRKLKTLASGPSKRRPWPAAVGATGMAALLLALGGCGGGAADTRSESLSPVSPQAAVQGLRARALQLSATGISAAELARQLMDFAEGSAYKSYFPGHPNTQSLPPFLYRAYANGVYLGVSSGNDATYPDGVWVMGGSFGASPQRVGAVTDYITPTDTSDGPTGANNGCQDLAMLDTSGNHLVTVFQVTSILNPTSTMTQDFLVGNVTGFEGYPLARESSYTFTVQVPGAGDTTMRGKQYQRRSGDAEITHYGSLDTNVGNVVGFTSNSSAKTVWSPPDVDRTAALSPGESFTRAMSEITTTTTHFGIPGLPDRVDSVQRTTNTTVKFVGRETVTVPSGTYATCRFDTSVDNQPGYTTDWRVDGKGVSVRSITYDGNGLAVTTMVSTSVILNRHPL